VLRRAALATLILVLLTISCWISLAGISSTLNPYLSLIRYRES